ncbi:Vacuolar protein sorting-associated protein Ist1 protein [Dioscorea alata]|uniref:Vacuolar protein sorting-associated protein Ist1 protein n=2 Tax=Dioscorea alata TaxID=55571 RepID=A0ACB7TVZ7_DIOAL|nr:Vacuolar protein sorting-associated protein Ist1 protein [Dioscorea alata]
MYKKSKNIAADMLPKSFKGAKCKTSLKLAMSRIKLMRNKKEIQVKQMRRDLAQLLEAGQEQTARIRVEHVIREEKTLSAYELIDIYCELIVARLPIIESQKTCPIDLREAVAGVVFASPRCADIPELMDVRKQFLAKYGKEFITSALEVRPDCGVSRLLVEKLSARAPDGQTKVKVMTSIAEEHNIKWDPKPFEDQLQKPNEDLLAGPSTFASVNQMPVKSSNFSGPPSSMNEPSTRMSQNEIPSKPTGFNASSAPNINTPSTSVPSVSHSIPDNMEGRPAWQEINSSNQMENGSLNRQSWNMEFKDATSAAQAAAESAERASMAARAAAELARRGSAPYDINDGLDRSEFAKAKDEYATKESVPMPYNDMKPSQGMHMRKESRKIDEVSQAGSRREAKETYDGYTGMPRSSGQSLYHSSDISGRNDHLEINQKVDERAPVRIQSSISNSEPLLQNYKDNQDEYNDYAEEIRNENCSKSASTSSFSDDTRWNTNSQMNANYEEKSETGARQGSFGGGQPVFDDYCFDEDDQLLDTFSTQQEEKQVRYLPTKDQFSPKQHESSFTDKDSSPQWMFETTTKSHHKDFEETNIKGDHSPHFDNNSTAFDDYDDHNYEGEDVFDKIMHEEVMEPSKVSFDQKNSSESSLSARSSQEPDKSYSFVNKEVEEANENHLSSVHSDGSEKIEAEPGYPDTKWKGSSSNKSIHNENASRNSINSEDEPFYNPREEKPQTRGPSRVPSLEAKSNNAVRMTSDAGISNYSSFDSVEGLKWGGRLTGGFKHKGFPQPPYQKDPLPNVSAPSKPSAIDRPSDEIESSYGEEYDQEPHSQAYQSKSRASNVLLDFSKDKSSESNYTAERRGRTDEDPSLGNSSGNIENHNFSNQKRESAKLDYAAYKSYGPRTPRQDLKEYSSESYSIPDFPSTRSKDNLDVTRSETPKQVVSDQEQGPKTNTQSRLKMPFGYFDEDTDEADTSEPYHAFSSEGKRGVKLSRRTRALPAESKRANNSSFTTQSNDPGEVEKRPQSNSVSESLNLERRQSSGSSQAKLSPQQPPVTPQAEPPKNKEIPKSSKLASVDSGAPVNTGLPKTSSSTEGLSSREDSLKKSSHVHPKLPDYESLAAHFHSLRANVRPQ